VGTDAEELARMSVGARTAATTAGVEVDGQRFRPHLTLARMHRPIEATRWIHVLEAYAGPSWQVEELALVESHLGEGRARHEVVGTFPLGS
jgi:2'-5' RNA ligase